MGDKIPKEYVAGLLKQLEELKKKKAHKERKLQKLKRCSLKDIREERAVKISHISNQKEQNQIDVNGASVKKLDQSVKNPETFLCERQISHSFDKDKSVLGAEKCHSGISIQTSLITADDDDMQNHNINRTATKCVKKFSNLNNSLKPGCKSSVVKPSFTIQEINSEMHEDNNLSLLNHKLSVQGKKSSSAIENTNIESEKQNMMLLYDNIICCGDKTSVVDNNIIEENAIHDREINNDITVEVKLDNVRVDLVSACTSNITKHNFLQSGNKSSNDSSKSLPSSKGKNSDILDDSLNSNMSFFMSADLFVNDDNDKRDLTKDKNDNELSVKNNDFLPPVEKDTETTDVELLHPDQSHLCLNGYQQSKMDVFNFPKFSTPTEGNTQVEKDYDIIGKSQTLSDVAKLCNSSKQAFKNILPQPSKIDSPVLSFVLEKRLSSVLDAHYESPKKIISKTKISSINTCDNLDYSGKDVSDGSAYKKRKLFTEVSLESTPKHQKFVPIDLDEKSNIVPCKSLEASDESDQEMKCDDFDNVNAFDSSFSNSLKNVSAPTVTLVNNSCDDVPSQISKTVDSLVNTVCDDALGHKVLTKESGIVKECVKLNEESKIDSEILIVPETEGLGLYLSKDTEEFLETSTLSESMEDFPIKDNFLNVSSQSKLESPVVNNIVAAVKSSRSFRSIHQEDNDVKISNNNCLDQTSKKVSATEASSTFDCSLGLDTSFLEDDTQDLGHFKQVPYMNDGNVDESVMTDKESNLKFICSLSSSVNEPVIDVEVVLFNNVKYAVLQHKTYICVWRQEKQKQWIKIFNHQIEDMLILVKICISMDDDALVVIMLLRDNEQYCLQFLIFEKEARVIKLMENTHWLEERCSEDSILLCGLSGLMFATAQNKGKPEVSIHAFISLKENPKLMTAVLGSTESPLCSLSKIDKLPNALMGIGDSMLYVWHILEARLVTAVSLQPHDYLPIKECFWATVENGLIYFLTTCEADDSHHVCQLLAANLATGFCQTAMTYSTLPSNDKVKRIIKAAYEEPFLTMAHSEGAFIWSVLEEFCCAALPSKSNTTSIAISKDFDNWGLLAVGSKDGLINCYSLH